MQNFNPLPRKEGDGETLNATECIGGNFNPLPRKEGDINQNGGWYRALISIHSLVKRETQVQSKKNIARHFNPLPRKEGDALYFM